MNIQPSRAARTPRNAVLRDLNPVDWEEAADLVGRGMDDNPIHLAAYPRAAGWRRRAHSRMVHALIRVSPELHLLGVETDRALVAVAGSAAVGACRPRAAARLRLFVVAATLGPVAAVRLARWNAAWARHDPDEPHVHLGPVAVDAGMRGRGLGGILLAEHVRRLDAVGAVGYLETDRPEAVPFYERFGYVVVGRATVIGVPCWFMRRPAAS